MNWNISSLFQEQVKSCRCLVYSIMFCAILVFGLILFSSKKSSSLENSPIDYTYSDFFDENFQASQSVKKDYEIYFNSSVDKVNVIWPISKKYQGQPIFLTEREIDKQKFLDLRSYNKTFTSGKILYVGTDNGIFFTTRNIDIRNIYNFLISQKSTEIIITDYGFLTFNRFDIGQVHYVHISMRKKGYSTLVFRGILLNFNEYMNFADILSELT